MSAVLLNEIYKETTLLDFLWQICFFHTDIQLEYFHQFTSEDEHQEELKSVKTEFIKEGREKMRDPEPCRIKHTEDTEQQTGC